jgi:5-methylcytosine-specific restriction endonuclease McrA
MDKSFKGSPEEYKEFRRKRNEINRRYYSRPEVKERIKKYAQEYRQINKQKISEYGFKLRARPEYQERIKKWRNENKEHLKEIGVGWRKKNKEYKKRLDREYFLKNRKKVNDSQRKWARKNRKIVRAYNQKYYTSPKGIINYTKHNHRRIALIKSRPFNLTKENIKKIINRDKNCVYCGNGDVLELDHIVPLKLGGNSLYNNFVLACKSCNCRKSGKDVFVWCKEQGIEVPKIVIGLLEKQKLTT